MPDDNFEKIRRNLRQEVPYLRADRERIRRMLAEETNVSRRLRLERDLACVVATLKGILSIIGPVPPENDEGEH